MNKALLAEYIGTLQQRIERIGSLQAKLAEGNPKADENVRLLAHSLHGSGTSFGFPEISQAAKDVEYADSDVIVAKLDTLKGTLEKVVSDNSSLLQQPGDATTDPDAATTAREATDSRSDATPEPEQVKVLKILVVEDDADMASLITRILQTLPKKQDIKVANNAAMAQEAVVKGSFDLIIMDLMLPDRDGRELIQEIKLEFKLGTPLLVLSGIQNDSVRVECMSLGADKYLNKPFYEDDLLNEVKHLLGKKIKKKLALVPLDGEIPEEDPDEDAGRQSLDGRSILLAEDDRMQADLIRQRLIGQGASVKHASNGREAMQHLRMQEFSLLILDVKMPVMDGFEVLQRTRRELKLDIPVIMVTAMGSEEDIIRGYELGAADYILKPFSEVQLIARVKSLLK